MGILRDFERRLEGAVEGFFAKLFKSGLQPVELAKALQRYAGNYQQVGVAGVFVPNVYRFDLSADDYERFSGFESSLERELSDVVRRTARDRGWELQGPVRIELRQSDAVRVGTYELRGKVKAEVGGDPAARRPPQPAPAPRPSAPEADRADPDRGGAAAWSDGPPRRDAEGDFAGQAVERTTIMDASGTATPTLHLLNGSQPGRRIELQGRTLIGRLPECDVQLDDPSVSRRHARMSNRAGGWSIEDLDSTNGVKVNGTSVHQTTLEHGDVVELGSVRLTFALEA